MLNSANMAFVFPGQGSQVVGMLSDLADTHKIIKETFAQASEVLSEDLWALAQQGPQDHLNLTKNAQPVLLAASVAIWRLIRSEMGLVPGVLAGHSLGEWSALVCGGALAFEDAVRLVRLRGLYMQEAVPLGQGTMAAIIGLDDAAIEQCCVDAAQGEVVAAVNYNSPGQVVIAGNLKAVERAMELCKSAGAKRALPLSVSAPFHTDLMRSAADRLADDMNAVEFFLPKIPVVHNVHAAQAHSVQELKDLMTRQIYAPVKWVSCIESIRSMGMTEVVECGPGKVLSGLLKRIDKSLNPYSTDTVSALEELNAAAN